MAEYDFGQGEIKELKRELQKYKKANSELHTRIMQIKELVEELVVTAFAACELRDLWRLKFGLPTKCEEPKENGDMP
jgi:predicted RNase H-like nuclease (RuvC/YqgF family)